MRLSAALFIMPAERSPKKRREGGLKSVAKVSAYPNLVALFGGRRSLESTISEVSIPD